MSCHERRVLKKHTQSPAGTSERNIVRFFYFSCIRFFSEYQEDLLTRLLYTESVVHIDLASYCPSYNMLAWRIFDLFIYPECFFGERFTDSSVRGSYVPFLDRTVVCSGLGRIGAEIEDLRRDIIIIVQRDNIRYIHNKQYVKILLDL